MLGEIVAVGVRKAQEEEERALKDLMEPIVGG
jgi:hypothetical protein